MPVVVNNLLVEMGKAPRQGNYNGYSSCPLLVGDNKLMMIEFKYGSVSDETFLVDQTVPRKSFYYMKKEIFPRAYFHYLPTGNWYGRNVFKPKF